MKRNSITYILWITAAALLFAAGCSKPSEQTGDPGTAEQGIQIRIGIDNGKGADYINSPQGAKTRAVEVAEGNESKIDTLTFLFFDETGKSVLKRTFTPEILSDGTEQPYWASRGIVSFPKEDNEKIEQATSLYVVANRIPEATTKDGLLAETIKKEFFPQSSLSLFVMEGHRENGTAFDLTDVPLATVQLKRCAAKLRLFVTLGKPGQGNLAGMTRWGDNPRSRRMNVTLESHIVEPTVDGSTHDLERDWDSSMTNFFPGDYIPEDIATQGGELPYLQGYAYEVDWSVHAQHELTIYMRLPYRYIDPDLNLEVGNLRNFYKIHLDVQQLKRNTLYEVYVKVNDFGSPSIDFPAVLQERTVYIYDWFGDPIDVTVPNDYLSIPSTRFDMYGETVRFRYSASSQPDGYMVNLIEGENGQNDYEVLPDTEATVDLRDYSVGSGDAVIWRSPQTRFAFPSPRRFYCMMRVRTIVKPVEIEQWASSHYGVNADGAPDYLHVISPVDSNEYPIGYSLQLYNPTEKTYITSNEASANDVVSPNFVLFSQPFTASNGRVFSPTDEVATSYDAEQYCLELQKATGEVWVLPTRKELELVALGCRTPKEDGTVWNQLPAGLYFVAQHTTSYQGHVVSIPEGTSTEVYNYGTGIKYKVRCVKNID